MNRRGFFGKALAALGGAVLAKYVSAEPQPIVTSGYVQVAGQETWQMGTVTTNSYSAGSAIHWVDVKDAERNSSGATFTAGL